MFPGRLSIFCGKLNYFKKGKLINRQSLYETGQFFQVNCFPVWRLLEKLDMTIYVSFIFSFNFCLICIKVYLIFTCCNLYTIQFLDKVKSLFIFLTDFLKTYIRHP